ncbi:hypothetical protein F5I97DRAFT_1801853 [Phlebopus sp. FC_14]|nr:hypothetical protein F5I97DRAFT_1801853 [Phlebopus sp. FC_14]
MRLFLSSSDYLNTDLSDERGNKIYTVSTPHARKEVTTVTKHASGDSNDADQVIGVIEWHKTKATMIQVNGRAVAADTMLARQHRHFTGPDGRPYKWKLEGLKPKNTNIRLAKFHKRNLGLMNPSHPPYLEIATSAAHMMDCVVITFMYVENVRQQRQRQQMVAQNLASHTHHTMMQNQMAIQSQMNQMMTQNQINQTTMFSPPAPGPGC